MKFVTMRMTQEIYDRLKAQAQENNRSVSGEIAHILKKALG